MNIRMNKVELCLKLKENKKIHEANYKLAWAGYKKKGLQEMRKKIEKADLAKEGDTLDFYINLSPPVNNTKDYENALEMLNWESGDTIDLAETDFRQYVMDEWGWKKSEVYLNTLYTGSASPSTIDLK